MANKIYIYKWNMNDSINYLVRKDGSYGTKKNV